MSSMRRRGTMASSTSAGHNYPNFYIPQGNIDEHYDQEVPPTPTHPHSNNKKNRRGSLHGSFLSEKLSADEWRIDEDEDVKTDVLYPRFNATKDDHHVDIAAFNRMVEDRNRKLSTGTLQLSRTLSRQNQLYGSSKYGEFTQPPLGVRFKIYSAQKNSYLTARLDQLLSEQGQQALESMIQSRGWWLDVLSPSPEEMRVLSKTFRIHPLTAEDIQAQEPREKVEVFPNYTFVCFRTFELDEVTDRIIPFNFYALIFKEGLLTFHFKKSDHCDTVTERANQLKEYMLITPDWMNYALIDAVTDSFAPIILQVELEAISIDELSLVLKESEQGDMLRRISRCRKKSTQLSRLLTSKLDLIKSLMKRYEDKNREFLMMEQQQQLSFPQQVSNALIAATATGASSTALNSKLNTSTNSPIYTFFDEKKAFNDVLLYLGDIQDHVVTMLQNINHYDRILHRAHTNYLAQVNLELSGTYHLTNIVMNRLTFLATVHIPLTLVGSLWGMNVEVPGKDYTDLSYFYWILGGMALYCVACICYGIRVGIL